MTPASETSDPNGMLQKNPFRYRGYYYDVETGWYYLGARYYNPLVRRFISSDTEIALGKNVGNNTYAYCDNNPISNIDVFGEWTLSLTFGYELGYFLNVYSGTSISIDGHGNIAVQKVYTENKGRECIAGLNLNICLSTSIQWTGLDKVANLEGEGGIIGLPAMQIGRRQLAWT